MATERTDIIRKEKNRRSNKPLMEKKRREKINKSLNELKEIVLRAQNKDISKFTKLEKADILDLTVKHLQKLHKDGKISPDIKNPECDKYKQGFENCLIEVEKYIKNNDNFYHLPKSKQIISHLKEICSKIPSEEVCKHSTGQTNKVKATVDTSVFRSAIISHRYPDEQRVPTAVVLPQHQNEYHINTVKIPPPFHGEHINPTVVIGPQPENDHHIQSPKSLPNNFYIKQGNMEYSIKDTRLVVDNYPPSPPDSLRCSSSPDSLRGSPRSSIDVNLSTNPPSFEKQNSSTPFMECSNYSVKLEAEFESKPLNLTVPSNTPRQENLSTIYHPISKPSPSGLQSSSSSSSCTIHIEQELPFDSHPDYAYKPPLQRYSYDNYFKSKAQKTAKGSGSSRESHSCNRTAPYPKKEVVKRYQNENSPLGDAEGEGGQRNHQNAQANLQHEDLTQSHWRPWY